MKRKRLWLLIIPFIIAGFLLLFTYSYPIIRYGLILACGVIVLIKREKLIRLAKNLSTLKRNKISIVY